jgi:transposase
MNPKDPIVLSRQQKIRSLLMGGVPISKVAKEVGLSRKRVYDYAIRENLPYNPPVQPNGKVERRILEALAAGFSHNEVAEMYKMAPVVIDHIKQRLKSTWTETTPSSSTLGKRNP